MRGHRAYRTFRLQPGITQGRSHPVQAEVFPRLHCIFYCISPLPIWKPPPPPRSPTLDPAGSQRKSVCKSYRETSLNPFQTETGLLGSPLPSPILGGAREHRTGHDQEPVENRKRKPGQASLYAIETARRKAHSSLYTQWLRSLDLKLSGNFTHHPTLTNHSYLSDKGTIRVT